MIDHHSVNFFDQQFQRQIGAAEFSLNPFETLVFPVLQGDVLDYGCGLGNLASAVASRQCRVHALDGSPAAISHLQARANAESLAIRAELADLRHHTLNTSYDGIACIGLLMFFDCATARKVLGHLQASVRPGGILALNVLVTGTTFLDMFDPEGYCLFEPAELDAGFATWETLHSEISEFPAPRNTVKRFLTLIARKPE
jgi:tellurite methyltransferase